MAKAMQTTGNVGIHPTTCDHCGGKVEEIGLVAPKCISCGKFSLSHISFGPMREVDIDLKIIIDDGEGNA